LVATDESLPFILRFIPSYDKNAFTRWPIPYTMGLGLILGLLQMEMRYGNG
jgi:hypothetical protein